jgi:hypothetical protein
MPLDKLIVVWLPIALGIVMIGVGWSTSSLLDRSATPSRVGVIRPVFIG